MRTFWSFVTFVGLVAVVTCLVGMVVGHLRWARLGNRKHIGFALGVASVVFVAASLGAAPHPVKVGTSTVVSDSPRSDAGPAVTTSAAAPLSSVVSASPRTSTAPAQATRTSQEATTPAAHPSAAAPRTTRAVAPPAVRSSNPAHVVTPSTSPTHAAANLCGAPANPYGYNYCGSGSEITSPASDVCRYFSCIGNFANGKGYMVECRDGDVSMSGGRRGACSDHGGELRPVNA